MVDELERTGETMFPLPSQETTVQYEKEITRTRPFWVTRHAAGKSGKNSFNLNSSFKFTGNRL